MKFTEEEFYGNTQNTVLDNGDVVPLNREEESNKQTLSLTSTILTTFLKTIVCLFCTIFYIISVTICLAPSMAVKAFDLIGASKASLSCYERIYEKDKTLANLYNVVQKSIQNKDHKKTAKYIKELRGKSDYVNFCLKVNNATLKVTNREHVAFLGDLDGYLVSQNIMAEYNTNHEDNAKSIALSDLANKNVYSFGFSSFVDCLENDKSLSQDELNAKILEVANLIVDNKSVLDLIKERRVLVDVSNSDNSVNDKILRVYASLKIEKVLHKIYSVQGEEDLKNQTAQNIQNLQNEYSELIR